MSHSCVKCMTSVGERDGYENSIGEAICNPCFQLLWSRKKPERVSLEERALLAARQTRGLFA